MNNEEFFIIEYYKNIKFSMRMKLIKYINMCDYEIISFSYNIMKNSVTCRMKEVIQKISTQNKEPLRMNHGSDCSGK